MAKKIFELERTNLELVKHGIFLTNKTIEAMLKGVSSVTKEYNRKGQNISKEQLEMSSIIEETLVQMPLPKGLNEETVIAAIHPDKDVDAFHTRNVGKIMLGK